MSDCVDLAHQAGGEHWRRNHVPVYYYEAAALRPERRRLEEVRKGGFRRLSEAVLTDERRRPDVGGPGLHPSAGAAIFGARKFLIAYNVNLRTQDLDLAQAIARRIRASSGGFPCVKALGVRLKSRGLVQVTTSLTDFEITPPHIVFQAIAAQAAQAGVEVAGSELIGLLPRKALEMAGQTDFRWERWEDSMVLETRLERATAGSHD